MHYDISEDEWLKIMEKSLKMDVSNFEKLKLDLDFYNSLKDQMFDTMRVPMSYWTANYETINNTKSYEIPQNRKENYVKKSDLKDGMKVYLRNGDKMLVLGKKLIDIEKNGYILLDSYDENLKYKRDKYYDQKQQEQWEIVKVLVYDYGWKDVPLIPQKVEKTVQVATERLTIKVILEGDKTTVLLPDGTKGSTIRVDPDVYNEQRGIEVALLKAQIKQLQGRLNGFRK